MKCLAYIALAVCLVNIFAFITDIELAVSWVIVSFIPLGMIIRIRLKEAKK